MTYEEMVDRLTVKELAVVLLVGEGLSNKDIARRMFRSYDNVRGHLYLAFRKLGVTSRYPLIAIVLRHKITEELRQEISNNPWLSVIVGDGRITAIDSEGKVIEPPDVTTWTSKADK